MIRKRKPRSGMWAVFLAVAAILAVITVKKADLDSRLGELMEDKAKFEKEAADLEEEEKKIEEYKDYINSDEYIEDIARNKLGLIYPDEYIFEEEE